MVGSQRAMPQVEHQSLLELLFAATMNKLFRRSAFIRLLVEVFEFINYLRLEPEMGTLFPLCYVLLLQKITPLNQSNTCQWYFAA